MADIERWLVSSDDHDHVVEIVDAGLGRRLTWCVDGAEVAARKTSDERVVLDGGRHGAIGVRLPALVGPARRVTWWSADAELGAVGAAHTGLGGLDLDPEPGSKAAEREAWIRAHPRRYAARRTATAVAGVVVPLVVLWLLARVAVPAIPWPDWDLPSIPWPDLPLPSIPWPDIPLPHISITVPDWVRTVADYAKYVWPVALALALTRAEVKRRRQQDERKRAERD